MTLLELKGAKPDDKLTSPVQRMFSDALKAYQAAIADAKLDDKLTVKTFSGWEIKDADKGEVETVVATLEVIDRDGEIIRTESVPDDAKAAMSDWGHSLVFGKRPVGKGRLVVDGKKLKFVGRLFLKTI